MKNHLQLFNHLMLSTRQFLRVLLIAALLAFVIGVGMPAIAQTDAADDQSPTPSQQPVWRDRPVLPKQQRGYLGMVVRDAPGAEGAVASWVYPGPLEGNSFIGKFIRRGDVVVSVDGHVLFADDFDDYFSRLRAGDKVVMEIRHSEMENIYRVPNPGPGKTIIKRTVVLADRAIWTGPIDVQQPDDQPRDLSRLGPTDDERTPLEAFIDPYMQENDLKEPYDLLEGVLKKWLDDTNAMQQLDAVSYAFTYPSRMPELEQSVTNGLPRLGTRPQEVFDEAADRLGVARPTAAEPVDLTNPEEAVKQVAAALLLAKQTAADAWSNGRADDRDALIDDITYLVTQYDNWNSIERQPDPKRSIRTLRASLDLDQAKMLQAAAHLAGLISKSKLPEKSHSRVDVSKAVRAAVTGDILAAVETEAGIVVFGGFGRNRYNMDLLAGVIDPGGRDFYDYSKPLPTHARVIVDMEGDDQYEGKNGGPGSGWAGVDLIVDYAGDDRYKSTFGGCGAGMFGVGLIVEHTGGDLYEGDFLSCAAAMYGLGAILDLGQSDIYKSAVFSQALGAAGGYALMYDRSGNDYYQLNGPVPSVYGVEGSFLGGGQGLGIGWRGYTTGGLGVIFDQNGNDRYIAGEFAQGTGYFWGFGVLHDARGNDVYMSDRYGGGIGCHQAAGALVDESGNDIYAGKTAASLGAAWDIAVGLFIDHSGNDSYRADNMSKGAGSMQGIAWCLDLAGDDHYATQSSYTQGLSGTNTYRYHATGAMSWSFFLDAAGGSDHYNASERANNKSLATGSFNEDDPQMSRLYGLFLDVEEPLNLRQR